MRERLKYERRIYFFVCAKCGKEDRRTYKRKKQREAICRNCRREDDPNQMNLFFTEADKIWMDTLTESFNTTKYD